MRRWRSITAGSIAVVLGAGLAVSGVTSASAVTAGHWGTFTLGGTARAYSGAVALPGFPATTFTSDASQATVPSGASTWQGPATPSGTVYGSSRGNPYLNQRPAANNPQGPATTTYTFAGGTPGAGGWSFVLGDVDADQATITATLADGTPASVGQLGFRGVYNSCSAVSPGGWSCPSDDSGIPVGQDVPTWDATTGVLSGNATASDTAGASAWFTPTASLATLTITYQQRSGFPVYQTWFANRTSSLSGVATLDGAPLLGTLVTATAPNGTEYTTTTDDDGAYAFDALTQADGYRVSITPPENATVQTAPGAIALRADVTGADFGFVTPPGTVGVDGTVVDTDGVPVADATVVVTDPATGTTLAEVGTDGDGRWTAPGLPAGTAISATTDGGTPVTATTGAAGAPSVTVPPIVVQAPLGTVGGRVTLDGAAPAAPATVELLQGGEVVTTFETAADGTYDLRLRPGTYTVRTIAPVTGATGPTEVTVTVTADGTATADFPFASPVQQTVSQAGTVSYSDGSPVAGTAVTARPADAGAGSAVVVETGADGSFDLVGLTPATPYVLTVDGADAQTVTTVGSGAAPTPVAFVLPLPTVDQPGTVTDADGAPAAAAEVVATPTDPGAGSAVSTTTDAEGGFVLTGLRPSTEYSVVATGDDGAGEPVVVTTAAVGVAPTSLAVVVPAAAVPPTSGPTPTPTTPGAPAPSTPGTSPVGSGGGGVTGGGGLAFTGAELTPGLVAAGVLVLLGGGLLTVRKRRRASDPQD
ncbi:carboxypeptidase-like regulatory domain-containing protein [Curtobacterium caseinilyticum]|uniref:alpha-amylase n=1 Tax=Curtobacterium caseinilyticum TaxID=3055137 RepID=A0ABT7TKW9_9MICO|nr:carboxypeptidase-like regulatory domain-containing protein [Curtobacterium caseinilyticum]MDM7890175.1 carboxypeptidase-like regulatory domain-containing protein [Curtobacterium caseinilyticum]